MDTRISSTPAAPPAALAPAVRDELTAAVADIRRDCLAIIASDKSWFAPVLLRAVKTAIQRYAAANVVGFTRETAQVIKVPGTQYEVWVAVSPSMLIRAPGAPLKVMLALGDYEAAKGSPPLLALTAKWCVEQLPRLFEDVSGAAAAPLEVRAKIRDAGPRPTCTFVDVYFEVPTKASPEAGGDAGATAQLGCDSYEEVKI